MLYYKNGRSDPYRMFLGVCVFVDHASCFIIINNQVDKIPLKLSSKNSPLRGSLKVT